MLFYRLIFTKHVFTTVLDTNPGAETTWARKMHMWSSHLPQGDRKEAKVG